MRLFCIDEGDRFTEYGEQRFKDHYREETMESWLASNPDFILEDGGLLIIGRQVITNLSTAIDLLGLDREGNVTVVELKRDRTPRDTLAQALEYASFAASLDSDQLEQILRSYHLDESASLAESHRAFFRLEEGEAVAFNKDQRILLVADEITPPVRQSALYLRKKGLRVTCLEFAYFRSKSGEQLLSVDFAVGREPIGVGPVSGGSLPKIDREKFLQSCDEAGKAIFRGVLALADARQLPLHWGSRGFSLNVDLDSNHTAIAFGYCLPSRPEQSPQSLWTGFGEIGRKVLGSASLIDEFRRNLAGTGLFVRAGSEMKYLIRKVPSDEQITAVVETLRALAEGVSALHERSK
jgi:hypothetical protein